jgi:hypothetical protein
MTEDVAEYFWSPGAPSPYAGDGGGAVCYVDGGRRRSAATHWPRGDAPFFTGACDSGV